MRKTVAMFAVLALLTAAGSLLAEDKGPATITYEAKTGTVTFDHAKHVERAKGDCTACHDKLFQKTKGSPGYKEAMHKKAETAKTSCGACHHAGGMSFESKGNCAKCHVKK